MQHKCSKSIGLVNGLHSSITIKLLRVILIYHSIVSPFDLCAVVFLVLVVLFMMLLFFIHSLAWLAGSVFIHHPVVNSFFFVRCFFSLIGSVCSNGRAMCVLSSEEHFCSRKRVCQCLRSLWCWLPVYTLDSCFTACTNNGPFGSYTAIEVDDHWNITTRSQSDSEYQCSTFGWYGRLACSLSCFKLDTAVIGHLFYITEWRCAVLIFFPCHFMSFGIFIDGLHFFRCSHSHFFLHWTHSAQCYSSKVIGLGSRSHHIHPQ